MQTPNPITTRYAPSTVKTLRGLAKVSLEWEWVCLVYNCKRLHRRGAVLRLT